MTRRMSRRLGLFCPLPPSTSLVSPHGMANDANLTCAADVVAFTTAAMRYSFFQKVCLLSHTQCFQSRLAEVDFPTNPSTYPHYY